MEQNNIEKALKAYNDKAFTHNYIIIAKRWKQTVAIFTDWNNVKPYAFIDGDKLRLNLTTHAVKTLYMKAWKIENLGNDNAVKEETARLNKHGKKYNEGNGAESLVMKHHGQTWEWDNVPFTDGPDLWIDGVPYQVKTYRASFANLKSLGL